MREAAARSFVPLLRKRALILREKLRFCPNSTMEIIRAFPPSRHRSKEVSPKGRLWTPAGVISRLFLRLARTLVAVHAAFSAHAETLPPAAESGPCSLAQAAPATVALVDDDLDLLLDDGRRLSLAGLEFPQGAGEAVTLRAKAFARLSAWLPQAQVFIEPLTTAPDRWGQVPAQASAPASAEPDAALVSVGAALLAEGLARFRPEPAASACATPYLAAEALARRRKLGIWSVEPVVELAAATPAQLAELAHKKGMVVVAGVVRSVGETKTAFYLNFGVRRGEDFAAVIFKKNVVIFESVGVFPHALAGRRISIRGLIDWNTGPRMEISTAAQLELEDRETR